MSENCVNQSLGKLPLVYYQSLYPHSAAPCVNLHKSQPLQSEYDTIYEASKLFKPFQYNVTYPVPWFPPTSASRPALNGLDPCWIPVDKKHKWENSTRVLLKGCKRKGLSVDTLVDALKDSLNALKVPLNIALLAKHFENDPDDQFSGSYNWYFGGSNLDSITTDEGKMYLLRPDNTEEGKLFLTELRLNNHHWVPSMSDTYCIRTGEKGNIYQIQASNAHFLVRQKNTCSLFRVGTKSDLFVKLCNTVRRKFPFVSCSLSPLNQNHFATLSSNRELCLWNASLKRPVSCSVIPIEEHQQKTDNWGSVHYYDCNTVLFADRDGINVIDIRAGLDEIQVAWPIEKLTEICEQIYCATSGSHGLQYVVTNHQMLSLDLKQGFVQRWTHMIPNSPCIVNVHKQRDLADTVFIGSLHSDTLVAIENRWDESSSDFSESRVHPLTLPSMRESLHAARYQGHCLSSIIGERFNMSLTGICCIEDEDLNIVRCTSLGDIFIQRLVNKNSHTWTQVFSVEDCEVLTDWERKCEILLKKSKPQCVTTNIKHASHIIESINATVDTPNDVPARPVKNNAMSKWSISKKQLLKYCDYLAPKLLGIWDLDKEEEWSSKPLSSDDESFGVSSEEDDIFEKVTKWIDSNAKEMNVDEDVDITDVLETELVTEDVDQPQVDCTSEFPNDQVGTNETDTENQCLQPEIEPKPLPTKATPSRKKRTYESGF